MPGLAYDDSGILAAYFGLTCLSFVLLPTTFVTLRKSLLGDEKSRAAKNECSCQECRAKVKSMKKAEAKSIFSKRYLALLLGWIIFAALCYYISQAPSAGSTVYDPFEILGIPSSSDEAFIKKHFKRISLKFHPDKIKLAENQTKEEADAHFVDLTKAYKALTDDVTRENLQKYGNPDGVQSREETIAIPKWIVEGNNGIFVLAAYGLGLGGVLPWLVGRWWFSQRGLTKDGALSSTAEIFFHDLTEDISLSGLLGLLASAVEIREVLAKTTGKSKKEKKARAIQTDELEKTLIEKAKDIGLQERDLFSSVVSTAPARRASMLLWSHLLRYDDLSAEMLEERRQILLAVPTLIPSLLSISLAYHWLGTTRRIMDLYSRLVQAIPFGELPIAQLPGLGIKEAQSIAEKDLTLQTTGWQIRLMENAEALESVAKASDEAVRMTKELSTLKVSEAEFKVDDEETISPGSMVNFTYKVYLESIAPPKTSSKSQEGENFAHAPRWPAHRKPHWWVMIADPNANRVIVPPQRITDIPGYSAPGTAVDGDKKPKAKTFKLQFQAPPAPGQLKVHAYFVSDSYLACSVDLPIVLKVEAPAEIDGADDEDDDISDPEEDTLAGQMAALKGQKVKRANAGNDDSSSDEEDDNEVGSDDDSSDTDGEAPKRRQGAKPTDDSSDSDSD
ncbi:hypothetical protein NliqN6_2466 [Naganishia liquefaciens]|uniref:J domain-containing protein n=1 Tax=Naganishia liquefaciens TaxID=104408 RepID=A0A8H3YE47_9TREE|nr:hypothetical protein NliqN6_2466 [Naganishia liquefaciens]